MAGFAYEVPTATAASDESPFFLLFSSTFAETSDTTLTTLSRLSLALLEHRVASGVRKELNQLQGELRSEWAPRLKALKADYMARVVWADEPAARQREDEYGDNAGVAGDLREEEEDQNFEHPTIISDADAQTQMSAALDLQAEQAITSSLVDAESRIAKAVQATKSLELEVWLSGTIIEAYEISAGEEAAAARFLQDQFEDCLYSTSIDPQSILQK